MGALSGLFAALSQKQLQYVYIGLKPEIGQDPSSQELDELEENFSEFLKDQPELYYLYLYFDFMFSNAASLKIKCFGQMSQFVKENKHKLEEEAFEKLEVWIYGFYVLYFLFIILDLENDGVKEEIQEINEALGEDTKYKCEEEKDWKYGYSLGKK